MKSFYKNQIFIVYDHIINDLNERFFNRKSVTTAKELEELLLKA